MYQDTKSARLIAVCKRSLTCNLAFRRDFRSVTCSFGYIVATDFSFIYTYLDCCYNIFFTSRPALPPKRNTTQPACLKKKFIYRSVDIQRYLRCTIIFSSVLCHYYQIDI